MVEADGEAGGFLLAYVLSDLERPLRLCKLRHYEHRDREGPCAVCERLRASIGTKWPMPQTGSRTMVG
jgi:hypothetical protein